jgi:hypothetical protein
MTPGQQTFTVYAAPYGVGKTLSTTVKVGGLIGSTTKLLAPLPAMSEMELLAYVYQRNRLNQGIGVAPFEQLSVLSKRVEVPLAIEYTGRTKSLKHQALVNNELPRNIVQERLGGYYEGLSFEQIQLQRQAEDLLLRDKYGIKNQVVDYKSVIERNTGITLDKKALSSRRQLASSLQMQESSRIIAGAKSTTKFRDVDRIVETYGGMKEDWVKISSSKIDSIVYDSLEFETHWVENLRTGQKVEFKTIKIKE